MKKPLKIFFIVMGGMLLMLLIFALFVNVSGIPKYENLADDLEVELTEERISEGARMAAILCVHCHASTDGKLGGNEMLGGEEFGKIYASNITKHPEYGINDYTDGELAYLFRTGIRKDGQYVPPWMPKFPNLSDEDLYSIIAFLRSDHPLLDPSENNPPDVQPSFLAKMLSRTAFKPLPYPEGPIHSPDVTDKVAFGKYLADSKFDCYSCHSASFQKLDIMVPENSKGYFGGGSVLLNKELNEIISSNLTMDEETGIGKWTEDEFIRTLRFGMRPDNTPLRYPMVPAPMITEYEASAIWAYLQSIPVIANSTE